MDTKTKGILALKVTDEKIHDGKMLTKLVNHVLDSSSREPHKIKINSLLADGAYHSNPNFRYLEDKMIKPGIKVRKNSVVSPKNCFVA
ncbi:hypothetical protein BH23THE1_BH23THE1_21790 [soil metagenome]